MSYTENPGTNPYAAPQAAVGGYGPSAAFFGYAGFWRRVAASFIDGIILGMVNFLVAIVANVLASSAGADASQGILLLGQLVSLVIQVAYYAGMESSASQATLGKMAMGCKVTDLHGRRISLGRAIGRYFAKILSAITLFIGFIMVAFTEKKQGLHDMIAGTLVVKTR
jgi:uncharacterized RDD family membrane protein YckC